MSFPIHCWAAARRRSCSAPFRAAFRVTLFQPIPAHLLQEFGEAEVCSRLGLSRALRAVTARQ